MMRFPFRQLPTVLILLGLLMLAFYIGIGMSAVPFHADEALHLATSRDYIPYFVNSSPASLRVYPPIEIDSSPYLRLTSGTVHAYTTGFALWHGGDSTQDSETWSKGWYYGEGVASNRAAGRVPSDSVLQIGRIPSTLFTIGSVGLLYLIGAELRGWRVGIIAATFFTLHPAVLLNGRRVMQEGALAFFSLAVVLVGIYAAKNFSYRLWILLGVVSGLALASKMTALLVIGGVGVGLFFINVGQTHGLGGRILNSTVVSKADPAPYVTTKQRNAPTLLLSGLIAVIIFLALTPAIWSNPPARLWDAISLRREVLAGQADAATQTYDNWVERPLALFSQAFPDEAQYFESEDFADDELLAADIADYELQHLGGLRFPWVGRVFAAIFMGLGLLTLLNEIRLTLTAKMERFASPHTIVVLGWIIAVGLGLVLSIPMGWARYYLPWIPIAMLLVGVGIDVFLANFGNFLNRNKLKANG